MLKEMQLGMYYENRLERMRELCYVLDVYVYNNLPSLHSFLKQNEMNAPCYALSWFLTLHAQDLPLPPLTRLWILFILKGWKVIIKFSVALLCLFQLEIMRQEPAELPQFLRDLPTRLTAHKEPELWQLYLSIKVTNNSLSFLASRMKKLEFDSEVSLLQLKQMRESPCSYEANEMYDAPHRVGMGVCCDRVHPATTAPSFPYCTDF